MIAYRVFRAVLVVVVRPIWPITVEGLERLPRTGCVISPNHNSFADPVFVGVALPRPLRFLGRSELFRFPFRGFLNSLGAIPVVQGANDTGAIVTAVQAVRDGHAVVIHPQGTILGAPNRPWKRGASRVAIETGAPLVPVALIGIERVLKPGTPWVHRVAVRVVVGEPLDPGPARPPIEDEASALTERLRQAVQALGAPRTD